MPHTVERNRGSGEKVPGSLHGRKTPGKAYPLRLPRGRVAILVGALALLCLALPIGRWHRGEPGGTGDREREQIPPETRTEIIALQREIRALGYRWQAGFTSISHLSPAEFEGMLGARVPADEPPVALSTPPVLTGQATDLPARWDWREKQGVTPARMQGVCGSCWAFAAAGALEAMLRIYEARVLDLSEQHAIDCNLDGYSCDGGWMTGAYRLWQRDGARLETDRPYLGEDGRPCVPDSLPWATTVLGWTAIAPDRESVQRAILVGPVASAMHVYPDFQHYRGGVYEHEGRDPINHAVLLVGWDDTLGAWILKNSWGPGWGDDGFACVAYDDCRLGTYVHRIDIPAAATLRIDHAALVDTAAADLPLELRAVVGSLHAPIDIGSVTAWVDSGAGFSPLVLPRLGGTANSGTFAATLPVLRVGTHVRYFLSARDTQGNTVVLPPAGETDPLEFRVLRRLLRDDLETPGGWSAGVADDDANAGVWAWGEPEASHGVLDRLAQPGSDFSPDGRFCFATGLEAGADAGANDVDGGATTLRSPPFDLSGIRDATLRFRLWYSNQLGGYPWEDAFAVYGSRDDGATWALLYETHQGGVTWRRVSVPLHEFLPLGPEWRVCFVAADRDGDSVVEAAIDDLEILTASPEAPDAGGPGPAEGAPPSLRLGSNPSRGPLELHLVSNDAGPSTIGIYDAAGRRVRALWRGELPAGTRALVWDGCDDAGCPVGSGRYWARITTPGATITRAIVRLR